MIRSTPVGAALAALSIVASVLTAVWVSGFFPIFSENRGVLQLLVAIPLASLVAGGCFAFMNAFTRAQMLWGVFLVGCLLFVGIGALGPGYAAWPWAFAIGAAVFVPWLAGVLIGSALGRRRRESMGTQRA